MRSYNKRKRPKHSYKGKYRLIDSDEYIFVEGGRYKEFIQATKIIYPSIERLVSNALKNLATMFSKCTKAINKILGLED